MTFYDILKYITLYIGLLNSFCFCQSPQTVANIQISFLNNGTHTSFNLSLSNVITNSWFAVGLNDSPKMVCLIFIDLM